MNFKPLSFLCYVITLVVWILLIANAETVEVKLLGDLMLMCTVTLILYMSGIDEDDDDDGI